MEPANGALRDFTGEYFLSEEEFPPGFTDFARLELKTHRDDPRSAVDAARTPVAPTGAVHTDRTYPIRTIAINREFLVFETEVSDGISYRFSGKVLQTEERDAGNLRQSGVGDIVGRLEKLKNGRVTAMMETRFFLFGI